MLYYVKLKGNVLFKGNYYACIEYILGLEVGSNHLEVSSRK
jgi:hypothetical protein